MSRWKASMSMDREGNRWGQNHMTIRWGNYSPIRMQYLKERTPQKLWLELLGKSCLGMIYWTTLVEFLRNLFWFQLKAGGLAPQVGFLAYLFIPSVVVGRPAFRQFLDKHPWSRALLVVGGVLGLSGEFQGSISMRLTLSACGVGLLGIYLWEGMWATTTARRERTAFGMVGGVILLQVLRWAFAGPNPVVARWWGLMFLGIIPGICSALLVLCEDLAESEGGELQSFIEDEDLELDEIELGPDNEDFWRFKKEDDANFTSLATTNMEVRSQVDTLEGNNVTAIVTSATIDEQETTVQPQNAGAVVECLDVKPRDHGQGSNPNRFEKQEIQQGPSRVEDSTSEEIVESDSAKASMKDTFQAWSWGFGVEAFRQARTDETELTSYLPSHNVTEAFVGMINRHNTEMNNLRQERHVNEHLNPVRRSFQRALASPKSVASPVKNKRWGEGEEVPWLKDVKGYNDISDSELDVYRHKDTKWNIGSCLRTAQMGIGSGSLLFLTHWILTAPTSFARWQGLSSDIGWTSILSLTLGLVAATEYPRILCLRRTQGLVFWVFAAMGASVLMWSGSGTMLGSALLAFSAPSLWISIAQCNLERYPGGGLGIMVLVYIIFVVWSTSLVAYQSIPALSFLRGTRGILMGCSVAGIGLGVGREPGTAAKERAAHGGMWQGLFTSAIDARGRQAVGALVVLVGVIWAVSFGVRHHVSGVSSIEEPLRVLNFNIQQGFSRAGTANYDAVLSVLRKEQPHFVMLQETDMMHIAHGNIDMIDYWATHLRMHSLYTPGTKSDTWGCSMLSIYPFMYSESAVLSSPQGENACYQYGQVEVAGKVVHLVNSHFGTLENEIALQAEELAGILRRILNPADNKKVWLLFAGDLNAAPLSVGYNLTVSTGVTDSYVTQNGEWKGPGDRDPGAGYVFASPAFNCTSYTEPQYNQQETSDGDPIVATFDFL